MSADWTDATSSKTSSTAWTRPLPKAFVEADVDALRSDGMIAAFDQMRLMVDKYMDPAIAGRDFDTTAAMLSNGDAMFFIMGDWSIGTFISTGHKPGEDILCGQSPNDWGQPASSSTRTL